MTNPFATLALGEPGKKRHTIFITNKAISYNVRLMPTPEKTNKTKPTWLQITWSMFAAFCGVQNNTNHDRDDDYIEEVGFKPYIIIGTIMTIVIIIAIYVLVQVVLGAASS